MQSSIQAQAQLKFWRVAPQHAHLIKEWIVSSSEGMSDYQQDVISMKDTMVTTAVSPINCDSGVNVHVELPT